MVVLYHLDDSEILNSAFPLKRKQFNIFSFRNLTFLELRTFRLSARSVEIGQAPACMIPASFICLYFARGKMHIA